MLIENSPFFSLHLQYKRLACVVEFPHQGPHTNTQTPCCFSFSHRARFFNGLYVIQSYPVTWSRRMRMLCFVFNKWEWLVLWFLSQSIPDSPENNDANIKKIAREVLENRAYICSHPLERTFWVLPCDYNTVSSILIGRYEVPISCHYPFHWYFFCLTLFEHLINKLTVLWFQLLYFNNHGSRDYTRHFLMMIVVFSRLINFSAVINYCTRYYEPTWYTR